MIAGIRWLTLAAGLLVLGARQPPEVAIGLAVCGLVAAGARWIPAWTSLGLAVGAGAIGFHRAEPSSAIALGLGWLAAHRALAARGQERGTILLSALMVITGVATQPVPLAWAAGVLWAALLPFSLLSGVRRIRSGQAAWGAVSVGLTLGFYLLIPRFLDVERTLDSPPVTGFSLEVELGRAEGPADQDEVMLRVRPAEGEAIYLRGMVLDRFDGRKWSTELDARPVEPPGPGGGVHLMIEATHPESAAFTAGDPRRIRAASPLLRTSSGTWMFADPVWGWTVDADPPFVAGGRSAGVPPDDVDTWLPPELDPRIRALARELGAGRSALDAAEAKLSGWRYTREPTRVTADPLVTFLFDRRAGHCEHFASALGVLLRGAGLPARVITGYATAEQADGAWVVRRLNAHAWVEVWIDGAWETVDATPGPLARPASPRIDPQQALERWTEWDRLAWWALVRVVAPVCLFGAAIAAIVALAARFAPAGWRGPMDPVERAHWRARRGLRRLGWSIPVSLPPLAAAQWVAARTPDRPAGEALIALAWLLYNRRWGGLEPRSAAAEAAALTERIARIGRPPAGPTRSEGGGGHAERARDPDRLQSGS